MGYWVVTGFDNDGNVEAMRVNVPCAYDTVEELAKNENVAHVTAEWKVTP